jgi:hypothetical protein
MKNNLIFTGLFESPREYTEGILREFIKNELGIEEYIEFGNVHRFGRRETPDRKPRPIVARFIYNRQLTLILQNESISDQFCAQALLFTIAHHGV